MVKTSSKNQRCAVTPSPVCNYCKWRGHVLAECWALEKKKANNPVMIIITENSSCPHAKTQSLPEEQGHRVKRNTLIFLMDLYH